MLHTTRSSSTSSPPTRPTVFPSRTNSRQYLQSQQKKQHLPVYPSLSHHTSSTTDNSSITTTTTTTTTTTSTLSSSLSSTTTITTPQQQQQEQRNNSENVKVAVRCRPLSHKESFGKGDNAWHIDTSLAKIRLAEGVVRRPLQQQQQQSSTSSMNTEYHFDNVAYGSDNNALYNTSVKPLISQAMNGYNGRRKKSQ
ncbi:uncharacterized protein BX664DRAFT_78721 [Halteromyces radiatus]|uniref:uncharacterized protein n=1 Tax=Halteromyces radiatus TaxID=101107 RepID=UPI00222056EA|nr:uncharacterized protein BX664DRAFT_78721 [Halteromyces radiatus]KAI8097367.1 hypothetical protein BX664DRAFT_78721 [Halteromyces radiatus]